MQTLLQVQGENVLYFEIQNKGLAMVTGCGHGGVLNLLEYARHTFVGGERLYAVYGGLHIAPFEDWNADKDRLIEALAAYRIEYFGFLPWDNGWLGVMITPWFMSLLWVPNDREVILGQMGDKVMQYLPAGDYEFVVAHEDGIGDYLSCSLCSPMSPFADHESARVTAVAVMESVLQVADKAVDPAPSRQADAPRSRRPLSRRDLLFGRFLSGKT